MFASSAMPSEPLSVYGQPTKRTTRPIVTGSTVLAVKYKGGVLIAADTMGAYGSLLRFPNVERITQIGAHTLIGAGGEISDFQQIKKSLTAHEIDDWNFQDNSTMSPQEWSSLLARIMHNKRSRINPYWNEVVVAGFKDGKPHLGFVDMYGTNFSESFVATGFGSFMATPYLRTLVKPDMTEAEAREVMLKCFKILVVRHCHQHNKIIFAKANEQGTTIEDPIRIQGRWDFADFLKPTSSVSLASCSW